MMARSTTPRASEANRHAPSLLRALSDPTSSHSGFNLLPDGAASPTTLLEDLSSSPEASFPSTPQSSIEESEPSSHDGYSYFSRFSPRAVNTIHEDLAATLECDYSPALSDFPRPPSLVVAATGEDCEFEPGTSARTVRNFLTRQSIHSAHHRTASAQSATIEWTPEMDGTPTSPMTMSSFTSGETSSSATSSDYGDLIDFLSFRSDSDEECAATSGSHEESSLRRSPSLSELERATDDDEPRESSGDDTARLDRLDRSAFGTGTSVSEAELTDAGEGVHERGGSSRNASDYYRDHDNRGNGYLSSRGGGSSGGHGQGSGSGKPGKDGDDDWNRRLPGRTSAPPPNDSDTSEDEDEEESSDDYGQDQPAPKPNTSAATRPPRNRSSDDDVPLAQQIPTALKAQRTIRRQVKDEIDQRRRTRSVRQASTAERSPQLSPKHVTKPLPLESISARVRATVSTSHDLTPLSASAPVRRPRTKTMPSQPASPFSIGELTKKLLHVQTRTDVLPLPSPQSASSSRRSQDLPFPRSPMSARDSPSDHTARLYTHGDQSAGGLRPPSDASAGIARRLLPMRSFHRPRTANSEHDKAPPLPLTGAKLGRSATTASRKHHDTSLTTATHTPAAPSSRDEGRSSLDRARSTRSHSRRTSAERSSRPSGEHGARPPMPSLPSGEIAIVTQFMWQQRIFIVNLQRYCQVELHSGSTAKDILEVLQNQGELGGTATGWMVWELCQDFGMGEC